MAKLLIVGLGSIGRRHLKNLKTLYENDIILCRTGKGTLPDDELCDYACEHTLSAALGHKPDAVIICNPTSLHMQTAIDAAKAGCHLFLEKPISHSLEGLAELNHLVTTKNLICMVGFQYRFHPTLQRMKQRIEEGAIGKIIHAHAHWGEYLPDWHPWEDYKNSYSARSELGGGVVLTLCHPIDYLQWIVGDVISVFAVTRQSETLGINVEDIADLTLTHGSGACSTIHLDYIQRPKSHHLQVVGDKGTMVWDHRSGGLQCFDTGSNGWKLYNCPSDFERDTMFKDEMRHFIDCVRRQSQPAIDLRSGMQSLSVCLTAKQSTLEQKICDVPVVI